MAMLLHENLLFNLMFLVSFWQDISLKQVCLENACSFTESLSAMWNFHSTSLILDEVDFSYFMSHHKQKEVEVLLRLYDLKTIRYTELKSLVTIVI